MNLDVAFLPSLLHATGGCVCVVIDVLRATSTLSALCHAGIAHVTVVGSPDEALALRGAPGEAAPLICGEVGGLPPAGFDYGNSAVEFSRLDLRGQTAVLCTSNGTRALLQVAAQPIVLAGSLLNRSAVMRAALAAATAGELDLQLVCSGVGLGTRFSLEDAYCAGSLVQAALDTEPSLALGDGARAALRLFRSYEGDTGSVFLDAEHGRTLERLGFAADLEFCGTNDRLSAVPRLYQEGGRAVIRSTATA